VTDGLARTRFDELKQRTEPIPYEELEEFWFRDQVTATMVYDAMPIHDHFKKVDDNAVVAITNGKGALDNGRYMYFYLERA
jgi:Domain of unknown function (DUF4334)